MKRVNLRLQGVRTVAPFGKPVSFASDVLTMIVMDDRFIVRLDSYDDPPETWGREIKAYTPEGDLLWEIEPSGYTFGVGDTDAPSSYTGLGIDEERGVVTAYDGKGFEFDLDTDTGKISNERWVR